MLAGAFSDMFHPGISPVVEALMLLTGLPACDRASMLLQKVHASTSGEKRQRTETVQPALSSWRSQNRPYPLLWLVWQLLCLLCVRWRSSYRCECLSICRRSGRWECHSCSRH
jgi:hypothetical protein